MCQRKWLWFHDASLLAALWKRCDRSVLLVAFLLVVCLAVFAGIVDLVFEDRALQFDEVVLQALRPNAPAGLPIGPTWVLGALQDLTSLGSTSVLTLITVMSAAFLAFRRKLDSSLFLIVAVASGTAMSMLLKGIFQRARPELGSHLLTDYSFPSGHTLMSAVVYLTLGALLAQSDPRLHIRLFFMSVAIALTAVVGCSRVYLGVHWPTDVIAGWCIGVAWAALCWLSQRIIVGQIGTAG